MEEICQIVNETQLLVRALKQTSSVVSIEDQGQQTKLKDVRKEPNHLLQMHNGNKNPLLQSQEVVGICSKIINRFAL